jgi:hypothetical protein
MSKPLEPYVFWKPDGNGYGWWLEHDTSDGRSAVAFFTAPDKAKAFRQAQGIPPEYAIARMKQPEFFRWLRQNLLRGIPLVMVDPDASGGKAVEILRLLAEES